MSSSPLSSKLTLVVPTRNRPGMLDRLLKYWEMSMPPLPIIVADSSEASPMAVNKALCAETKKHDISHHAFDGEIAFIEKVARAVELVRTPYMFLCADDDFLLPSPLAEFLANLEAAPDIVCVQGLSVFFRPAISVGYNDRLLLDVHSGYRLDQSTATERLNAHLGHYRALIYSLRRTSEFLEDVRLVVPLQDQLMLMELALGSLDAIRGKISRPEKVMTMIESHPGGAYHKHKKVTYWNQVIFAPDFSHWLGIYIQIIASQLERFSGLRGEAAEEEVRRSLVAFSQEHFTMRAPKIDNKAKFFNLPVVGPVIKKAWLKAAKLYDYCRLMNKHGQALKAEDFRDLIKYLEKHIGYAPDKSIIR
ncbi:TIGR00180 family glycosyltransferase [Prosthecobacter sp. SYSU 5D2]|uniref:TIGR00180 family glycosyltransferase n=1 Tax=Prosthecobacter sp. SYSU 5D2 TaxID=3134134 RepID=UPI0031FEBD56